MVTRPSSEPTSLAVGVVVSCVLTLVTGWVVLRGAPFDVAIPTMGGLVVGSVVLLLRGPRTRS